MWEINIDQSNNMAMNMNERIQFHSSCVMLGNTGEVTSWNINISISKDREAQLLSAQCDLNKAALWPAGLLEPPGDHSPGHPLTFVGCLGFSGSQWSIHINVTETTPLNSSRNKW